MDKIDQARRSALMSRIRGNDTRPELAVRRLVHKLGYRFRLRRRDLPGKPDLVFPGRRKVIFVHGCFWHQHEGCRRTNVPKSRLSYWGPKLARNVERDATAAAVLNLLGWKVLVVWECQTADAEALSCILINFLGKRLEGEHAHQVQR